jgi:hypothetical protein
MTLQGEAKRKAPVRAEPHPTYADPPQRRPASPPRFPQTSITRRERGLCGAFGADPKFSPEGFQTFLGLCDR